MGEENVFTIKYLFHGGIREANRGENGCLGKDEGREGGSKRTSGRLRGTRYSVLYVRVR